MHVVSAAWGCKKKIVFRFFYVQYIIALHFTAWLQKKKSMHGRKEHRPLNVVEWTGVTIFSTWLAQAHTYTMFYILLVITYIIMQA